MSKCIYCNFKRRKGGAIAGEAISEACDGYGHNKIIYNDIEHNFFLECPYDADYASTSVYISYCPMCGRKLEPPKEPLIKDEKIRKAVRTWAEACRLNHVSYKLSTNEFYDPDTRGKFAIKFTLKPVEVRLEDGECYTIAELCGEEEE